MVHHCLHICEALDAIPDNIDPSPPTRWGRGYKGPRRESFPLPDEYALDADETPLDQITVKTLTACFTALLNSKPHPCRGAWEKRLPIYNPRTMENNNNSIKIQQLSSHPKGLPPPFQTHHTPTDWDQQ
eukprot:scaffold668_cov148-Isochrysis_galbana.AAC.1